MNSASQPQEDNSSSWIEGIRAVGETAREKERIRDARLDKIIDELDSCDIVWYLKYSDGNDVAMSFLSYKEHGYDGVDEKMHQNYVLQRKRHIVEQCIIPAMHACIRAGFLKPSDEQ